MSTYSWSISGNATISGATNGQTVSVLANNSCGSFTLTLTITDANGCTSTCNQTFDITQPPFTFNQPVDATAAACTFTDQAALNAATRSMGNTADHDHFSSRWLCTTVDQQLHQPKHQPVCWR